MHTLPPWTRVQHVPRVSHGLHAQRTQMTNLFVSSPSVEKPRNGRLCCRKPLVCACVCVCVHVHARWILNTLWCSFQSIISFSSSSRACGTADWSQQHFCSLKYDKALSRTNLFTPFVHPSVCPFTHSLTSVHPITAAEWRLSGLVLWKWCVAGPRCELLQGGFTRSSHARRELAAPGPFSSTHTRRRSLYACGHWIAVTASECRAQRRETMCSAAWQRRKHTRKWGWEGQGSGDRVSDMFSLATATPSLYLSAGLRPAGKGRRAATGRRHSRTPASSRTSRAEAERSLPPAGRRLTGARRGGLHYGTLRLAEVPRRYAPADADVKNSLQDKSY